MLKNFRNFEKCVEIPNRKKSQNVYSLRGKKFGGALGAANKPLNTAIFAFHCSLKNNFPKILKNF